MAFYNEIFEEVNGKLVHIASCCGSNTPDYFDNIKTDDDWRKAIIRRSSEGEFWFRSDKHPFPWSSYKTSDHLIVLIENRKKWFEIWKPKVKVYVSVDKYDINDEDKCYFIDINKWVGDLEDDEIYENRILLDLPKLIK